MIRVVLLSLFAIGLIHADTRVWLDSIALPTYAEGDPDPVPQFAAFLTDQPANYPYPFRSTLKTSAQDRSTVPWRTLNLENEYLFCRILPDLGGRIYNCLDKLNHREVFHTSAVIGAWIATGVEPNFPVTHSRLSASPVNFAIRTGADGVASVFISDTDRLTGLQWRVEYRLAPGIARLEERVTFYNPTPVRKPYFWWNNAAIEWDDPGIRYVFPAHMVVSHGGGRIETWPVNSAGVDISVVANDVKDVAWFASQSREPFMAVYKPKFRVGVAHFADARAVAGKKLGIIGQDQVADDRHGLGDGGTRYIEMQAGLFTDQETYAFLGPAQSQSFTEYWMPFRDMSGLTRATPDMLLYAAKSASSPLMVELGATRVIAGAHIRILSGTRSVSEAEADLDPRTVWRGSAPPGAQPPLTIQVSDSTGRILLLHQDGMYAASGSAGVKIGERKPIDWNGPETQGLLLHRGEFKEKLSQTRFARSDYSIGLRRFPRDLEFDKAAGRLDLSLGRFEDALAELKRAMATPSLDPETAYYAGVATSLNGREDEARSLFSEVGESSEFAMGARVELAFLAARGGDYARALSLTGPLEADPGRAAPLAGIRASLLRHLGSKEAALAEIKRGLAWAPEDPLLRYEATLMGAGDPDLWNYLCGDAERVLNIADGYMRLGMWEDALASLERDYSKANPRFIEPGAVGPEQSALAAYYRAYCKIMLKKDAADDLRSASKLGTLYQFPNRLSSYAVLRAAVVANPSDATAHVLLGDLDMYSLRMEDAAVEWRKALTLNPELDRVREELTQSLALIRLEEKPPADIPSAKPVVPRVLTPPAVSLPTPPRAGAELIQAASNAMIRAASSSAPENELAIFSGPAFAAEKQPPEVRQAYLEVRLQVLLALSSTGKCQDIDDRIESLGAEDTGLAFTMYGFTQWQKAPHIQYYLGVIEANCGHSKQAQKFWAKTAKLKEPPASPEFAYPLLSIFRMAPAQAKASGAEGETALKNSPAGEVTRFNDALMLRIEGNEGAAIAALTRVARGSQDPVVRYLATIEITRDVLHR